MHGGLGGLGASEVFDCGPLTQSALEAAHAAAGLEQHFARLVSVKGIAQARAITLLAELMVLWADMSARQWVAHAGLDPKHSESGASVKGRVRISKVGNRQLRGALFLPAMVASRHDARVRAQSPKLSRAGTRAGHAKRS